MADSYRHSTPHHLGAEKRGGLAVIPLLLKHIEEKHHAGLWQEEEQNHHDGWSQPPSHYLEASASQLPWMHHLFLSALSFLFPPSFLFIFPLHLHLLLFKQLSSHRYSTHSFNLYSFVLPAHPLTPTLSISWSSVSSLAPSILIHLMWTPHNCTTHRFCRVETLWFCSSLIAYLVLCLAWSPAALGKGCVPGWIPACVVLISPEWPLHHHWGCLYCLGNFTTMPLAALTPVTWSLSPQQLMKGVW